MSGYQHYCLFGEPWWLDIVCSPGSWDEVRVETSGRIEARIPYITSKSKGLIRIGMPAFTQTLGPYFSSEKGKYCTVLTRQKHLVDELVHKLPKHHIFRQAFHHNVTNLLPWHWQAFQHTTRYSYIISDLTKEERLWSELRSNIRWDIGKAANRYELTIREDLDPDTLLHLANKTSERQGRRPLPAALVRRVVERATDLGHGKSFFAVDPDNRVHAGVFIVWDERTAYYLIGGGDPALRASGAHSLLLWEAILHASRVSKSFDFEGSMVESIERFFRAFGGHQRPYTAVWRASSRLLAAALHFNAGLATLTSPSCP